MRTPQFNFRLRADDANQLREIAKIYSDAGTTTLLLRDMVSTVISGNPQKMGEFNARILDRLNRQMTLELEQTMERQAAKLRRTKKHEKPPRK